MRERTRESERERELERERENFDCAHIPLCALPPIPSVRVNLTVQTVLEIFNFEIHEKKIVTLWATVEPPKSCSKCRIQCLTVSKEVQFEVTSVH